MHIGYKEIIHVHVMCLLSTTYVSGLDIKHLVYMPIRHVVLKVYVPCKNFHMPRKNLYKPCKAYVYCWESKYMPRLKNHLTSRARNHKRLCALGQDLHAPGMRARLNVEPCVFLSHLLDHFSNSHTISTTHTMCLNYEDPTRLKSWRWRSCLGLNELITLESGKENSKQKSR